MKNGFLLLAFILTTSFANAQPVRAKPTPNDSLKSVKILPTGEVILSIYAPKATEVTVKGDFLDSGELKLEKSDIGVWSVNLGKLTPNYYTYDFVVDGVKTIDPNNPKFYENYLGTANYFEMEGPETAYFSLQNVPHGRIETVFYHSTAFNAEKRMHVYFTPNYDKTKGKLPVLYLIHGHNSNDMTWLSISKANFILDNLYAEGKLKDMIVVLPAGMSDKATYAMEAGGEKDPFMHDMLDDIIPFVEKTYRASSERKDRAIAGRSMGGVQTMNLALWHPEKFGYVFPLSTGYFEKSRKDLEEKYTAVLKNPELNKFINFTIYNGDKDFFVPDTKATMALFDKYGIKQKLVLHHGGHTNLVWRQQLRDFAPLLFR